MYSSYKHFKKSAFKKNFFFYFYKCANFSDGLPFKKIGFQPMTPNILSLLSSPLPAPPTSSLLLFLFFVLYSLIHAFLSLKIDYSGPLAKISGQTQSPCMGSGFCVDNSELDWIKSSHQFQFWLLFIHWLRFSKASDPVSFKVLNIYFWCLHSLLAEYLSDGLHTS